MRNEQIEIFISASGDSSRVWTTELHDVIAKECGIPKSSIYLYHGNRAGLGEDIPLEIITSLEQAKVLICIINDDYLTSPWCLREHYEFYSKRDGQQPYVIGVLHSTLVEYGGLSRKPIDELSGKLVPVLQAKIEAHPGHATRGDALVAHAHDVWCKWLINDRHIDLRSDRYINLDIGKVGHWDSDNRYSEMSKLLDQIRTAKQRADETYFREIQVVKNVGIQRAGALAAFSLAADRFFEGGWGFSVGDLFSYDDEDDDELSRGRYDFNVLIMRALRQFLPNEILNTEFHAALAEHSDRQPRWRVTDRLPSVAKYVAEYELEHSQNLRDRLLMELKEIRTHLSGQPPQPRYGVNYKRGSGISSQVVLDFHFYCLSQNFWMKDPERSRRIGLSRGEIDDYILELRDPIDRWLEQHNLLSIALGDALVDERASLTISVLWCILAGEERGRQRIRNLLDARLPTEASANDFANRISKVFDVALKRQSSANGPLIASLACIYVLTKWPRSQRGPALETARTKLFDSVENAFAQADGIRLLFKLNCIGWALLVLILNDLLKAKSENAELDKDALLRMWTNGRKLREERVSSLQECSVDDLKDGALQRRVCAFVEDLIRKNQREFEALGPQPNEAIKLIAEDATYWPNRLRLASGTASLTHNTLIGTLSVTASSQKVQQDSRGYSWLFLLPFSEVTKMNMANLLSVRRELGDDDHTLVEKMGAVVVERCYERKGPVYVPLKTDSFKSRTERIAAQLAQENWPTAYGFEDLLKLRGAAEKPTRWVMRTAMLQPVMGNPQGVRESDDEPVIIWQFTEIDESIAKAMIAPESGEPVSAKPLA